jgi:hypothetical protein
MTPEYSPTHHETVKSFDFPYLYIMLHTTGTSIPGVFEDIDPSSFEKMMRVNYFGSVSLITLSYHTIMHI